MNFKKQVSLQQRGRIPISMSWHVKTYIQAVQVTKAQLSLLRKTVKDKTSKATPRYHCSKQQCHCGAAALEALASCGSAHVGTWRLPQSFATVILEHTLRVPDLTSQTQAVMWSLPSWSYSFTKCWNISSSLLLFFPFHFFLLFYFCILFDQTGWPS